QAAGSWVALDGLFNLTMALFTTAWLLGWSLGLAVLYGLLALLGFGREVVVLRPGSVEVRLGLPLLFVRFRLDPTRITNLHRRIPEPGAGTAWRGPHLAFDYAGTRMELGSDLDPATAEGLAERIRALPVTTVAAAPGFFLSAPRRLPGDVAQAAETEPAASSTAADGSRLTALALLAANLVPIAGVLLFGWDLGRLMVLFWAESAVIGCFNLLKMAVVQRWAALFTGLLFVSHFGAFMAVHFLFVFELFVARQGSGDSALADVGRYLYALWPALLALLLSHGLSFYYHFIGQGEYRRQRPRELMRGPYDRIMIMHVTVIIGGGLSLALGSPVAALLLPVTLKIAVDIRAHRRSHLRS
ncbi:MAG: DUF6498-containing protein, partial [Pseudomonadota bacterium]